MDKRNARLVMALLCFFCFGICIGPENAQATQKTLRFGVAAMISPKETISTYRQILFYLSEKLGQPVEMVQRRTYAEMDKLLQTQDVPIAMICSGPYVADHEDFGAELLVAPQMYGEPFYHSYLIVSKDTAIKNMQDLRGKSFAFTDPKSNTGCIVPKYMLSKMGESPDSFFSRFEYSGHHSKSIEMVAQKKVDGAAVDHLIWEYMDNTNPKFTSETKVVAKSPAYGMPPIVVHPNIDKDLKQKIRDIFLNMNSDPFGEKIIKKLFIDKFIVPKDHNYDTVREMRNYLNKHK